MNGDQCDLPWLCRGDFNELLSRQEKRGGSEKSLSGMLQFRAALDFCELDDMGFMGPNFTWNNKRHDKANIQERLDRLLAKHNWKDKFENNRMEHLGFKSSDHRPILLVCSAVFNQRCDFVRNFHFEQCWLKESDIVRVVEGAWNIRGPTCSTKELKEKLDVCASKLVNFASLFKSSNPSFQDISKATVSIKCNLNDDHSTSWIASFTAKEIKIVVFSLSPTKSPGLDGFQAIFFHTRICL
ncbi:hypothetical protein Ddye_025806 [Dipteronia dyeriana]|uniref:Endonuclease/exonuclease/phosphatase domain-containing protein n=1 Tax=Dipteronia dyeriana TaxID=168575 RepID=A0AAD9WNV8_9ROSI|nr:hypothetical protein Ddye_025806 [Dipteronia dyeriana]